MSFQEKLKELRLKNGLSQKKLADEIGVAQSSINYWEKGQRMPSVDAAHRLAEYFNISIDELYSLEFKDVPQGPVTNAEATKAYFKKKNAPTTIAAHFDGDEFTEDELEEIRKFAEFVKSRRKDIE